MTMPFIPYGQHRIDEEDIEAVVRVLRGEWLTQGPAIAEFESALSTICEVPHAVAVSSGTAALHCAFAAAGIIQGDEVITTPLTFSATAAAVAYCGGTPVFADIDARTYCLDSREVEKKITARTKAIVPVDFAGHPADYSALRAIADKYGLLLIADSCHALGAKYQGRPVGTYADMTILSFHPVKHIATGEGGAVLTLHDRFVEPLRVFRHHGIVKMPEQGGWYYEIERLGNNYRLTDIQAALGLSQLKKLDRFVERRREIAALYNRAFAPHEVVTTPYEASDVRSSYHLYLATLDVERIGKSRREIFDALREQGIGVQVHYTPLHLQPYYAKTYGYKLGDFPRAEAYYERAITLPLFPHLQDADVHRVTNVLLNQVSYATA
ncbi:UDP-4-amino-4,6-dideoxy-N-acetyl-beta-L-altrosamine transaminase [Candidatus Uhrbacteria bacterium RIFCSPLOWO2_01_FULL_53_9]|uniref:UDP-4-amino-4, 6-dideoxy-N-acetyl-beta-L-altrosamine transaminase n=2 Tax=Candidatus Uhriibacteriota TaxID=1752732 RepID=A0A1F7V097_9BACT|nr:MAG: UDP-4-amino-4,6-dideoxy-N-acetyl-beta-L-altrosamine transaminase [Candidatus Uhrbacteria bacterium RIFCSPLOWO2_01_FULL_53_9]OGL89742.1 MAG: UDP-4-amino-4,6-dideoxy-N-acetyl-beta-L-altrosamine transaminase [Candidatus Uhrbacteria bacterium RIFCSPLOWO2_02_FULL_53_10]